MDVWADEGWLRQDDEVVEHLVRLLTDAVRGRFAMSTHQWSQHGGTALLFRGSFDGERAIVKLLVRHRELEWMEHVALRVPSVVPELFATGRQLADIELRWVVMELVPLALREWDGDRVTAAAAAFARAHAATADLEFEWPSVCGQDTVARWIDQAIEHASPGDARALLARLPADYAFIEATCERAVAHGDAHFGNVHVRDGAAVLLDPSPTVAWWPYDAADAHVVNARPDDRSDAVTALASARTALGLSGCREQDLPRVRAIAHAWHACRWWGKSPNLRTAGSHTHHISHLVTHALAQTMR